MVSFVLKKVYILCIKFLFLSFYFEFKASESTLAISSSGKSVVIVYYTVRTAMSDIASHIFPSSAEDSSNKAF